MVACCEHRNKSFQIYKRSDQVSLGGSACHLYLGAAWFEYWLEDRQTWLELMWFSWDREYLIRPLIHPSTSFIIHHLSCHWILYNLIYWLWRYIKKFCSMELGTFGIFCILLYYERWFLLLWDFWGGDWNFCLGMWNFVVW